MTRATSPSLGTKAIFSNIENCLKLTVLDLFLNVFDNKLLYYLNLII